MAQMRCPFHDVVFETETDHSKPGQRRDERGSPNKDGEHSHPMFSVGYGYVSGHVDCPLCLDAMERQDNQIMNLDDVFGAIETRAQREEQMKQERLQQRQRAQQARERAAGTRDRILQNLQQPAANVRQRPPASAGVRQPLRW